MRNLVVLKDLAEYVAAQLLSPIGRLPTLTRTLSTTTQRPGEALEASRPIPATNIAQQGSNQLSLEQPRNGVEYALTSLDKVRSESLSSFLSLS